MVKCLLKEGCELLICESEEQEKSLKKEGYIAAEIDLSYADVRDQIEVALASKEKPKAKPKKKDYETKDMKADK